MVALIVRITFTLSGSFVVTKTVLAPVLALAVCNDTSILPLWPGATCLADSKATVHPQDGATARICRGAVPRFVNMNTCLAVSPSGTLPKSLSTASNTMRGCSVCAGVCGIEESHAITMDARQRSRIEIVSRGPNAIGGAL